MPVYPGTEQPSFATPCTLEKCGFVERRIAFSSHTGTHVDGPAHLFREGKTLDQFSVDCFVGKGALLNLAGRSSREIDRKELEPHQRAIEQSEFILLHTGWSVFWGREHYFRGYPVLSTQAAYWIAAFGLKGLGIDAVSVDHEASTDYPVHRILLEREILIVENLANLESLAGSDFVFACFPLKLQEGDGSPVRAVAFGAGA
jgi:arylformamidase